MSPTEHRAAKLATRLAFFVAGFGIACWAPLVPFAKARLAVDDGTLGLLLLCLGIGSVPAMLLTGVLSARHGSRPIIIAGGLGLAVLLPLLALADTPIKLGLVLLGFGASLGSIDVAANIHALEVEHASDRPLMSGFHALFSIGGFAGSALMTFLLAEQIGAFTGTLICTALMLVAIAGAAPGLLRATNTEQTPLFVMPHGIVLLLAALTAITFLVEGAMLDWSALLLTDTKLVAAAQSGIGYMPFSVAMTVGRLGGDAVVARIGDRATMIWGSCIAIAGFAVLLTGPNAAIALAGFLLIGLGASNLVPVLFRRAGAQRVMPVGFAVAAITTTGYAGILVGPAGIGFVAKHSSLPTTFWILAAMMGAVTLCAGSVTADKS
jgi:predicted MFS family arabinose efflux permease